MHLKRPRRISCRFTLQSKICFHYTIEYIEFAIQIAKLPWRWRILSKWRTLFRRKLWRFLKGQQLFVPCYDTLHGFFISHFSHVWKIPDDEAAGYNSTVPSSHLRRCHYPFLENKNSFKSWICEKEREGSRIVMSRFRLAVLKYWCEYREYVLNFPLD